MSQKINNQENTKNQQESSNNTNDEFSNINTLEEEAIKERKAHFSELVNEFKFEDKIKIAKLRIREFLEYCNTKFKNNQTPEDDREIFVSFSGGKDSTVLLDLVVNVFQEMLKKKEIDKMYIVPAYAYEITFPETFGFIKNIKNIYKQNFIKDVYFSKPKLPWNEILKERGYPIFSKEISVRLNRIKNVKSQNGLTKWIFGVDTVKYKLSKERLFLLDDRMRNWTYKVSDNDYFNDTLNDEYYFYSEKCCNLIKGGLKNVRKPTFIGTMASESNLRKQSWIKHGCNIINKKREVSRPLSIFNKYDVWRYIFQYKININEKYGNFETHKTKIKNLCSYCKTKDIGKEIYSMIEGDLRYSRLGCISCPYGSHLEDKYDDFNRFEILLMESEMLYKSQVIDTGMYKILIDMDIDIQNYNELINPNTSLERFEYHKAKYNELKEIRRKQITKWYDNFEENLAEVITQIENYKNYKNYDPNGRNKNKIIDWIYDDEMLEKIYNNYIIDNEHNSIKFDEFLELIWQKRTEKLGGK